MGRERLKRQAAAETVLRHLHRETRVPVPHSASPTVTAKTRDLIKRYGLALLLASLALLVRKVFSFPEGAAIYPLPIAAVVLSAWYGGRGPGLFASLICITATWYWFIPPVNTWDVAPEHRPAFAIFIGLCLFLTEFSAGRRRAGQSLRASEQRFRALVQFSFSAWYWETDAQHRFTRLEVSEWPSDEPAFPSAQIGKTRWEHPSVDLDEEGWREHRATVDAHRPFRDFERAVPTGNGDKRYHSVSGLPVFDEAGRFVGYRGVGRDITDRKRAEAEHRAHVWFLESMDRINRAMQGTNEVERMMSNVLDAVLEVFACDRAWLVYPCDPEAPSWRAVMEHTRPEFPGAFAQHRDVPMTAGSAQAIRTMLASQGAVPAGAGHERAVESETAQQFGVRSQLLMALHPKGDRPYAFGLHQCSRPRTWTTQEQRLFEEIAHRLTEALTSLIAVRSLRESERRSEASQKIAHVGWWERDYVKGRVSMSDEACRIFGVRPLDLPQWQDRWVSLIHPDDREKTAAASEKALSGGPRYDVEYRVKRPDGAVRVVHSQGDVTFDQEGRPLRQFGAMQDITELRRVEHELRRKEAYLAEAQRLSHTGSWAYDPDGSARFWSDEMYRIYGLDPREPPPKREQRNSQIHPDDRESVDLQRQRLLRHKVAVEFEHRLVLPDGTSRHVYVRGHPVLGSAGEVLETIGTTVDITDRKRAEEELRTSEARFRTFVDHATDAFFLIDEHLSVVDVNRQACENLGYRRQELIGMHPRDFDVGLDEPSIDRLAERAKAGEVVTFETRHRRKDGTTLPVEIRSGTFRQGGKLFYLALARDITERELAEESLRQSQAYLTESQRLSHTGSWALDVASNQYLYTSEEFDRLFGFETRGEALTRGAILERMHPEDRAAWKRHLDKSLREKMDTTSQYRLVLPGGRIRHIQTIRHPVLNSAGEVVKLVGTSIDITERKQAEEERERLRRLETELSHANRLNTLGELTTSIAHEVSQPLGAMVASSGACVRWLAADPPAMAEARAALANIVEDGKRAREVIARIRALAKRQAPRTDLLDINRKILDVLSFVDQELGTRDVVLETRLDGSLPKVAGDRVQLQQVILNLVKNAIDAMSGVNERPRELTIVSAPRPDGVVVEVRDSGTGFDAQGADRLFEAFYTTKTDGLGVGLSISRSIVEAHGGRLWAVPNEPHGAVFAFSLPIAKEGQS